MTSQPDRSTTQTKSDRRNFVATSTAAAAAATMVHSSVEAAQEQQELRLALVGCGGRGRGAAQNSLTINDGVKLTAMVDVDPQQIDYALRTRELKAVADKIDVPDERKYIGLDAYKRVLDDPDIDVVMFTTPPGFRPYHIRDAVEAGKHVFAEKPTCVDPTGYRLCLECDERAAKSGTAIVTGTQYRRQTNYVGAVEQLRAGLIGDIVSAKSKYCSTGIWFKNRKEGMSDAEYQIYNWMHFIWLSGDQIAEQAVHNIDAMNWVMGSPPESAYGSGGRFTRPEGSEMWDSMSIEYTYPGNKLLTFTCRQIPQTEAGNGSVIYCTDGTMEIDAYSSGSRAFDRDGNEIWSMDGSLSDAYEQEHKALVDSIRAGKPIVELKQTAQSSLTAVMGRLAAYSGKTVTWKHVTEESTLDLFHQDLDWEGELPEAKVAIPGKYKLV